ncbi:phosphate system positive regulatory protein pho81 [Mortierella sp. AD031]|nr:phosphate system positive regulatory protein pho81 [Mortierella sp. AD031]
MKFGKQIQFQQIPEWQSHYMSYKGLKKIINSLIQEKAQISVTIAASPPPPGSTSEPEELVLLPHHREDENSTFLQSQKAAFFFKLERELEKVNSFYLQKESELKVRLRSLIDKEKVILSRQGRPGTSSSLNSLKEAFKQFEQDLNKLQKFVETNGTGFRKILKKWDKRSKSTTKELYLARQVDLQPCFNQDAMVELADSAAHHLLGLDDVQQGRPSSAPSSPVTNKPAPTHSYAPSSPMQQQMDELETDLFNALTANQPSVVQEILERRLATPSCTKNSSLGLESSSQRLHSNLIGPEHAREVVSRLFWRCCSETSVSDTVIQQLVETGLVNFKFVDDISDRTCLHEAAMVGRLSLLKLAVERGAAVEGSDVYGRRPLHYVSMYGYDDCATYLLSLNASLTVTDHDGFQPLIYSVMNGHSKCVEIFLASNVEIEASREGDPIPLSLACHYGHEDIAMMLIGRGADVLASNADGLEPLHITCREGHTRLAKTLTTRGARLDQEDKYMCWTPLFYAASEGHVECVKILLEAGCKVNVVDEHGKNPIYYAASEGHSDCVELLVEAGGKAIASPQDTVMETSAAVTASGMLASSTPSAVHFAVHPDSIDSPTNMDDLDMELIPSLSLPPPIIPFRIYGHNYLDKKFQVNLTLGHTSSSPDQAGVRQSPVHLYGTAQISSLKLVISSRPDNGMIPHNVILPLGESRKVYGFQVDSLDQFTVEFDIFPTYGSKAIGRAVALPITFLSPSVSVGKSLLPLFDAHLKVVGELAFEYTVIRPFEGVRLEVGGRLETYWKSTNSIDSTISAAATPLTGTPPSLIPVSTSTSRGTLPHPAPQTTLAGNVIPSYITASSLSGEYIQLSIQMTRDFIPVVFANWQLPVEGFDLALSDVSFAQFKRFGQIIHQKETSEDLESANVRLASSWKGAEWRHKVYERWMSLEQVLRILPKHIGVNLELKYPTVAERRFYRLNNTVEFNKFVDTILQTVYDSSSASHHRSFMFSSFNPVVCSALNWKQPNYAVFFSTHGGYNKGHRTGIQWTEDVVKAGSKRREPADPEILPTPKHGSAAVMFPNLIDGTGMGPPSSASSDTVTSSPRLDSPSSFPAVQNIHGETTSPSSDRFQETDKRCTSIKEAIKFARTNNLLGVICEATPLIQVPSLITHIKESGLILTSFGRLNKDPALVQVQKSHGVDAFMIMESEMESNHTLSEKYARAASSSSVIPLIEVEEGVLRYHSGVDS